MVYSSFRNSFIKHKSFCNLQWLECQEKFINCHFGITFLIELKVYLTNYLITHGFHEIKEGSSKRKTSRKVFNDIYCFLQESFQPVFQNTCFLSPWNVICICNPCIHSHSQIQTHTPIYERIRFLLHSFILLELNLFLHLRTLMTMLRLRKKSYTSFLISVTKAIIRKEQRAVPTARALLCNLFCTPHYLGGNCLLL